MKTICIYHSQDLDGLVSAAIVKHWFNQQKMNYLNSPKFKDVDVDFGTIDFLGWDYGDNVPDLSDYSKVIMCDISFPKEEMLKLCLAKQLNFIWIDHHQTSDIWNYMSNNRPNREYLPSGIRNNKFAACELTWKYFFPNEEMPEIVRLLGRYDCFGHKGTDEEQYVLHVQYGARSVINNYNQAYEWLQYALKDKFLFEHEGKAIHQQLESRGLHIYDYLYIEAKQTYKKAFEITLEERISGFPNSVERINRKFLCVNQPNFNYKNFNLDIGEYDGFASFEYVNGKWKFSLRSEKVDCSKIAKQYGGGGHFGASGFTCDSETMLKIINSN